MKKTIITFLIAASAQWASADGLKSLDSFMQGTQAARADFTQVVTSPGKDGQAARQKTSSGSFEFQRPGRFRFVYQKPFEQTIVADGQTLWFYDVDLNQVTQRPQAQALGSTPAALLASAPDLQALRADFTLESAPAQDGLEWVQAVPKAKEGQIRQLRVGFRGKELAAIELVDALGQRSRLDFSRFEPNVTLAATRFKFTAPAGADVLQQ